MNKKLIVVIIAAVLLAAVVVTTVLVLTNQTNKPDPDPDPKPQTVEVKLDKTSITVAEDEAASLVATTSDGSKVKFSVDNADVLAVSSSGRIIGKKQGTAVVTATGGSASATCNVTVIPSQKSEKYTLTLQNDELYVSLDTAKTAQKIQCKVVDVQSGAEVEAELTYTTSDPQIATVSEDGTIVPAGLGDAFVTVSYGGTTEIVSVGVYTLAVSTAADWDKMLQHVNDPYARFCLTNDIDYTGTLYKTYTDWQNNIADNRIFMGEVDGKGHKVANVTMDNSLGGEQSMFGCATAFYLHDIQFVNVNFTSTTAQYGICVAVGFGGKVYLNNGTSSTDDSTAQEVFDVDPTKYGSQIENVVCDFVYSAHGATGIANKMYGCSADNVFVNMRFVEGGTFSQADGDYAVAKDFYDWYGKHINNIVVCTNGGSVNRSPIVWNQSSVNADTVYVFDGKVAAAYKAYELFDSARWEISPTDLPKLK